MYEKPKTLMANSIAALFPFVTYGSQIRSDRTWIYYSIMPHTRCFFLFLAYFVYTLCSLFACLSFFFCFWFYIFQLAEHSFHLRPAGSRLVRSDLHIEYDDGIIESQPRTKVEAYAKVSARGMNWKMSR